jgi:hypothetical protein
MEDNMRLFRLIALGIVRVKDGVYYWLASDGQDVVLEDDAHLKELHEFLRDHPTPDTW